MPVQAPRQPAPVQAPLQPAPDQGYPQNMNMPVQAPRQPAPAQGYPQPAPAQGHTQNMQLQAHRQPTSVQGYSQDMQFQAHRQPALAQIFVLKGQYQYPQLTATQSATQLLQRDHDMKNQECDVWPQQPGQMVNPAHLDGSRVGHTQTQLNQPLNDAGSFAQHQPSRSLNAGPSKQPFAAPLSANVVGFEQKQSTVSKAEMQEDDHKKVSIKPGNKEKRLPEAVPEEPSVLDPYPGDDTFEKLTKFVNANPISRSELANDPEFCEDANLSVAATWFSLSTNIQFITDKERDFLVLLGELEDKEAVMDKVLNTFKAIYPDEMAHLTRLDCDTIDESDIAIVSYKEMKLVQALRSLKDPDRAIACVGNFLPDLSGPARRAEMPIEEAEPQPVPDRLPEEDGFRSEENLPVLGSFSPAPGQYFNYTTAMQDTPMTDTDESSADTTVVSQWVSDSDETILDREDSEETIRSIDEWMDGFY
ncbi:hypothetical protein BJ875DRAFT_50733 [Amylocarpus encephaloides]|uniref:Uncharacterized protein n=1 Tax=Amylocarpus encephaloides TaxID=45428 RepID=A0A9P7YGQ6_9HELO|nr:hypothetical protein BJ875DRAFT_50733 [Amylocarpus encephaloides]